MAYLRVETKVVEWMCASGNKNWIGEDHSWEFYFIFYEIMNQIWRERIAYNYFDTFDWFNQSSRFLTEQKMILYRISDKILNNCPNGEHGINTHKLILALKRSIATCTTKRRNERRSRMINVKEWRFDESVVCSDASIHSNHFNGFNAKQSTTKDRTVWVCVSDGSILSIRHSTGCLTLHVIVSWIVFSAMMINGHTHEIFLNQFLNNLNCDFSSFCWQILL